MEHLTSEEYMTSDKSYRNLSNEEFRIIHFLAAKAHYKRPNWEIGLKVCELQDGMGSLLLIPKESAGKNRLFKEQISDIMFKDADGIPVIVSLNTDKDDCLFELDVWKINFDRVVSYENLLNVIEESSVIIGDGFQ